MRSPRLIASWLLLALLSMGAATLMYRLGVPAAFMLGPMMAAIIVAMSGAGIRVHRNFSLGALSVMGCLISAFITPNLLAVYRDHWLLLSAANAAAMTIIVALGVFIGRRRWLPNTTAIWGLFPGAASAMVLLADIHRSDPRIVAMMQYSRILMVSLASIALAALFDQAYVGEEAAAGPLRLVWCLPDDYLPVLAGVALACGGYVASRLTGSGSLALLFPAFVGTVLQGLGLVTIEIPPFIFIPAFALTGWYIGLTFTRGAIRHCFDVLPVILAALSVVIFVCGLISLALARMLPEVDLLTAYLALSPGGIETIVIIARDTDVCLPLILASQFLRLLIVLSIGPYVAKTIAARQGRHQG